MHRLLRRRAVEPLVAGGGADSAPTSALHGVVQLMGTLCVVWGEITGGMYVRVINSEGHGDKKMDFWEMRAIHFFAQRNPKVAPTYINPQTTLTFSQT